MAPPHARRLAKLNGHRAQNGAPICAPDGRPTLADLRDAYLVGMREGREIEPSIAITDERLEKAGEAYVRLWLLRVHEGGTA